MGEAVAARYRAFLSYSHVDAAAAGRIHRALEFYRMPGRLVGQATPLGSAPKRLTPIFRDRDELPATDDLSAKIREALGRSDALIVLCSPAAHASAWVTREIEVFRQLCPGRPILAALIDGEPAQAFPEGLAPGAAAGIEPIAADFRKGRDGRRLALLKLIAGLTGVELDALVQRDAQREIRRVTAVTLVALMAVLTMAFLLVLAVNARREADLQRTKAEGMVEYMLTDLRTKLKGVGSLDAMRAVNRRAIEYYGDVQALGSLPDDSLERRARVLHAMGEDDLKRGSYASALARLREAHAATATTLARHPDDPKAIFAHAQSDYWIGRVHELNHEWKQAEQQYTLYAGAGERLVAIAPQDPVSMMERGWGLRNLGVIAQYGHRDAREAERLYRDAISWFAKASRIRPRDDEALAAQADTYAWIADSDYDRRLWVPALEARQRQYAINLRRYRLAPDNADRIYAVALAEFGVARQLAILGRISEANPLLGSAYQRLRQLRTRDPHNAEWLVVSAKIECEMLRRASQFAPLVTASTLSSEIESAGATLRAEHNPRSREIDRCMPPATIH